EEALRGRQAETGERCASDRCDGPELHQPRYAQALNRAFGLHADRVTYLEVLLAGSRLVDHHLVVARPCPLNERERIERRISRCDAETKIRSAAVDDRLAVAADELRVAVDSSFGLNDGGQGSALFEQRLVEGRLRDAP